MATLEIERLPDDPLAAAAEFLDRWVPLAEAALGAGGDLVVVLPEADHRHRSWRLAAVQELARRHAPQRVNAVAGGDGAAQAAAERFLAGAAGVTGHCFPLDGRGAGNVVS